VTDVIRYLLAPAMQARMLFGRGNDGTPMESLLADGAVPPGALRLRPDLLPLLQAAPLIPPLEATPWRAALQRWDEEIGAHAGRP
jgi:hypothetical protein